MFDGFVGAVIGGFEAAGGTVFGIGAMMEAALASGSDHRHNDFEIVEPRC